MVTTNSVKKRWYGSEQQQRVANSFVWVETSLLQPQANGVWHGAWDIAQYWYYSVLSPLCSTGHIAMNADLLKPGSDVLWHTQSYRDVVGAQFCLCPVQHLMSPSKELTLAKKAKKQGLEEKRACLRGAHCALCARFAKSRLFVEGHRGSG